MIRLVDLEKTYSSSSGKPIHALKVINLEVKQGEIFGVVGSSGAGKSTLIRCVNLLESPTRGQVWIAGESLTTLNIKKLRKIRRKVGMIFQQFNLLSLKTVDQNITLPLKLAHYPQAKIEEIVKSLLALTGLYDKQQAYPHELSGGQKQRVAIARALACEPSVLLCDEATSSLDPETTRNILQLLKDINQRLGITILLITHEVEVIKTLCDKVALLDEGRIIEQADIVQFFTKPASSLAKRFVSLSLQQELPSILQNRLYPDKKEHSHAILRIFFRGQAATEPLIAYLAHEIGIHLNILQANIEPIKNIVLGVMVAEVIENKTPLNRGIDYLLARGLQVEIIGYVDGTII